jgi:hypothetical protein
VSFRLNADVPFDKLVQLDAATQGLCQFDGKSLRGLFFYPDVRKVSLPNRLQASLT